MSLEQQIERLTAAIENLNGNIERALATPVAVQSVVEAAPVVEAVETKATPTVTVESVQSQCLAATRKDLANKTKIRDWLDSFKAKKVADLSAEQLLELSTKLEQL